MGFGSTAKKVQKMVDMAEKTYERLNELRGQISELRSTVEETGDRVETLEAEVTRQGALLDAIAEEHDVDVDSVSAATGETSDSTDESTGDDATADQAAAED